MKQLKVSEGKDWKRYDLNTGVKNITRNLQHYSITERLQQKL